ncbi:MAG: CRISPR-associated helicase Cas3' [Candidatus Nitrosocaldus sp.]|nr:CRISPR-associated helicase Cas3' [Candidatus Nitrosocaldus sp.]
MSTQQIKWADPTKKSHPDKSLEQHLKEVEEICNRFIEYYNISKEIKDIIVPIIKYHDHGKLHPCWNINNKKNPPHSLYSIYYIEYEGLLKQLKDKYKEYYPLILYLILKHHSALYDRTSHDDKFVKLLCSDIVRYTVKNMDIIRRIEIIDGFGLFKLADSLSASNIDFCPQRPNINIPTVQRILSSKGNIDEDRWREQLQLRSLNSPALLTAYTGWGKTDSSLLFFTNRDVKKVFYLFPMITAINKFHNKLEAEFKDDVEKYFYLYEYEMSSKFGESPDEAKEFTSALFVTSHFMKPIILTTIDQFLLTFLQLGKYYMKRPMFRNAGIVIDEVHLLNLKMLALLLHFVARFSAIYKLHILFMSATFSDALKRLIKDHLGDIEIMDLSNRYMELRRINYSLDKIGKTVIEDVEWIIGKLQENKRILIVVNTVETSILLAQKLKEELKNVHRPHIPILLIHGRFMYKDRITKEECIEELYHRPHVLISTQVCEVSLDVSYDILLTEIAPLPSLIQRFGRVNRYGKVTDTTNVYVYKAYKKNSSSRYPYEDSDMQLAMSILEEIHPLKSEYELLRKYNEVESYEILSKRMEDVKRELDFYALWERDERTAYFFSFKLDEKSVKKLLEIRDDISVNILPHPSSVKNVSIQNELSELLKKWNDRQRFATQQIIQILGKIRGYLIPVPIWLVAQYANRDEAGLPIVMFDRVIYSSNYGLIERGFDNIV